MTAIHGFFCVICYLNPDSYSNFFICVFMIYFSVGFVDTLGEGMTAMITKMDQRIQELTPPDARKEKEAESKAIGFFFMFRLFVRTLSIFAGGALSSKGYSIKLVYFILFFCPLTMFLYTLFIFKEARVSIICLNC
jgi:ammonia channel protein AmtB